MKKYNGVKAFIFSLALMITLLGGGPGSVRSYAVEEVTVNVSKSGQEDDTIGTDSDEEAVLGVRRENTEDTADIAGRVITIIVAAGIGFAMIYIKRRKNGDK